MSDVRTSILSREAAPRVAQILLTAQAIALAGRVLQPWHSIAKLANEMGRGVLVIGAGPDYLGVPGEEPGPTDHPTRLITTVGELQRIALSNITPPGERWLATHYMLLADLSPLPQ